VIQFRSNTLRTLLTLLGIVLGVASVVAMVSLGEGAQQEILSAIDAIGADLVHIKGQDAAERNVAELVNQSAGLSRSDVLDIKELLPRSTDIAYRTRHDLASTDLPLPREEIAVFGVSEGYADVHRLSVAQGRHLRPIDHRHQHRVAVIGADLARRSFPKGAIGKLLRLEYAFFRVVGVLGSSQTNGEIKDLPVDPHIYNTAILIPFDSVSEELAPLPPYGELDLVSLRVASTEETLVAKHRLVPTLLALHGEAKDVNIVAPEELLQQRQAAQRILNLVLICIAAISLIVGGIGVMNIMLANIMERIDEIGLRRAVGARKRDIRTQFLLEATTICVIGGLLGIILGLTLSFIVATATDLPVAFAWYSVVLSFGISVAVGIIFGAMPAMRAANVNPIEALQHV
jgi:putative ABC transport system permease protein